MKRRILNRLNKVISFTAGIQGAELKKIGLIR
jgi:hypothetical protein